jgi:PLP dependent protein
MTYNDLTFYLTNAEVTLVAVSKTQPVNAIKQLYDRGQRIFGENKVQELLEKKPQLPPDIQWHLIGHLQKNKVRHILPHVALIHGVDSLALLQEINKEAKKINKVSKILLQIYVAKEETKFGLEIAEVLEIVKLYNAESYSHIKICGVMGMASFTDDKAQVQQEFAQLKNIFLELKSSITKDTALFKEVSMGMSGDYTIAVEQGSTMVRIGSLLFGARG